MDDTGNVTIKLIFVIRHVNLFRPSFILLRTGRGADSIEYGVIPFSKVYGSTLKESVPLLKQIIIEGYDVYTLKNGSKIADKETFRELVEHHNMVLKDYSKSFCKLSLVEDSNDKSTDKICI